MRPPNPRPTPPKRRTVNNDKPEPINICNTCKFDINDCEPAIMTREINNTPFNSCTKCKFHEPKIITGSMWGYKRMLNVINWAIVLIVTVLFMYSIYKHWNL